MYYPKEYFSYNWFLLRIYEALPSAGLFLFLGSTLYVMIQILAQRLSGQVIQGNALPGSDNTGSQVQVVPYPHVERSLAWDLGFLAKRGAGVEVIIHRVVECWVSSLTVSPS